MPDPPHYRTNKRKPILHFYQIHGTDLKPFDSAKYLGVTIDRKLGWDPHISYVYNKASFMMSFLERNLRKCPSNTKLKCINALVRPILDYGCCVWDPRKSTQIDRLEKINKRAARFVTGNYTLRHGNTKQNMELLGWSPLQERRANIKLKMFYKIRSESVFAPLDDLIPLNTPRRPLNYFVPQSLTDTHLQSFFPSTIRLWNSLPESVKSADSIDTFEGALSSITIRTTY